MFKIRVSMIQIRRKGSHQPILLGNGKRKIKFQLNRVDYAKKSMLKKCPNNLQSSKKRTKD